MHGIELDKLITTDLFRITLFVTCSLGMNCRRFLSVKQRVNVFFNLFFEHELFGVGAWWGEGSSEDQGNANQKSSMPCKEQHRGYTDTHATYHESGSQNGLEDLCFETLIKEI